MQKLYIFFFLMVVCGKINGQSFNLQWQKCLGGSGNDKAFSIINTPDGGLLIAGNSYSNDGDVSGHHGPLNTSDAWVVKTNAAGQIQWQKSMGGSGNDEFVTALNTGDGNYLLVGSTNSTDGDVTGNHGQYDIWVVKLNPAGTVLWKKCYGGIKREIAVDAVMMNNTNLMIGGNSESADGDLFANRGGYDIWLFRINPNTGTLLSQNTYGSPLNDICTQLAYPCNNPNAVSVTLNPGMYELDWGTISPGNSPHSIRIELDTLINRVGTQANFTRTHSILYQKETHVGFSTQAMASDRCYPAAPFEGLSFLGGGLPYSFPFTCPPPPAPAPFTTYRHGGANSYKLTENSNRLICGESNDTSASFNLRGNFDAFIAENYINTNFTLIKGFGGSGNDMFREIITPLNNIYIAVGHTESNNGDVSGNHGGTDIWLVKLVKYENLVKGIVYADMNSNNTKDPGEPLYTQAIVKTEKAGAVAVSSYTSSGTFRNSVDTGTYTSTTILPAGYYAPIPATRNSVFNQYGLADSFSVAVAPIPGIKDLQVNIHQLTPVRPAREASYLLVYGNKGTATVNNTTTRFIKDSRMRWVSTSIPGVVSGDTITWNTGNIAPLVYDTISITVKDTIPPVLNIGDTVIYKAEILPVTGDQFVPDNVAISRQRVTGSYDPNDKAENHGGYITEPAAANGEALQYIIRFQNTGTDTAFDISITDTLDTRFNINSFRVLASSHPNYAVTIKDNRFVTWTFNNILLPDSFVNEPASNGFIAFEIKLNPGAVVLNDSIKNSASIYFDFNAPVKTNTVTTRIIGVAIPPVIPQIAGISSIYCTLAGVQAGKINNPSPAYSIEVKLDNQSLTYNSADSSFSFNISGLSIGSHIIKVTYTNAAGSESVSRNFTVDDFVQAVISTPNQTICKLSAPVSLQANTTVSWAGTGVSGSIFNPSVAGAGVHKIIATKTNGACPDSKDTLTITVDDFVQAVISTPNQNICKLSSPIALQANTSVSWAGTGVSGSTFNPSVAGVGVHKIIATKTNGTCPDSKDTLTITVDDFVQAVITTPNQTVCISVSPIALQANTNVSWVGTGVSGSTFNPTVAGAGTHQVIATKTNGSCPDSKDTLLITVNALLTPDVNLNASQNTLNSAASFSDLTAINAAAGGSSPLYIFAKDRNFTQVLQAESASSTYRVLPQILSVGANTLYVRMRSSENCVTSTTAIDSVQLTLLVNTPSKSELEQALKVFPNPNNGQFGFRFETGINDRVLVTVYDAIGKQVFKQDYGQVQQFNFGKTLDLRNRHAGRYTIQFRVGSIVITKKVNVVR